MIIVPRTKSSPSRPKLAESLEADAVSDRLDERALLLIISEPVDHPLRVIPSFITTKSVCEKLNLLFARKCMVNKFSMLKNLLNKRLKQVKEMGSHMAILDSQFTRLEAMGTTVEDLMIIMISLVSLFTLSILHL